MLLNFVVHILIHNLITYNMSISKQSNLNILTYISLGKYFFHLFPTIFWHFLCHIKMIYRWINIVYFYVSYKPFLNGYYTSLLPPQYAYVENNKIRSGRILICNRESNFHCAHDDRIVVWEKRQYYTYKIYIILLYWFIFVPCYNDAFFITRNRYYFCIMSVYAILMYLGTWSIFEFFVIL